jgi:hypothetical protein
LPSKVIGILQPGYIPWMGFFEQLLLSDVFVLYDDVQYDKHGWRNRNRLKGPNGPIWLTVPVITKKQKLPLLRDVRIDRTQSKWPQKHLGTMRQYYSKAPYFNQYFSILYDVLTNSWEFLLDLDVALISIIKEWLNIETDIILSSEIGCNDLDPNRRLIEIISNLGGNVFYEGSSGKNYLEIEEFEKAGIRVVFQDYAPVVYPQLFGDFEPYLSVLDLIFNCGPESRDYILSANPLAIT